MVRPREAVVKDLERLGVDVAAEEAAGILQVDDWYSATLTPERSTPQGEYVDDMYFKLGSVKVADLSVNFSKSLKGTPLPQQMV